MTSERSVDPVRGPERIRFANPPRANSPGAAAAGAGSDWSQPILFRPAGPESATADADTPAPAVWEPRNHPPPPEGRAAPPPAARATGSARPARLTYEVGTVERWHDEAVERAADLAVSAMSVPLRLLDVGCGAGRMLDELVQRVPYADVYVGIDPVAEVIADARQKVDPRVSLVRGAAEALPFADDSFDLVVATMSFGYWNDQRAGARELARVVTATGKVVLVEAAEPPRRKDAARTAKDIGAVLEAAGLRVERTETIRRSVLQRPQVRAYVACP